MKPAILTVLALGALPATASAETGPVIPRFADETATAGIDSTYAGAWQYMVGGGVASFDCNGDDRPDLLLAGGTNAAALFVNDSPAGGALRFRKAESGLELTEVTGAYALDIDSDGIRDVVLLRVGENLVMRGRGDCRFEPANADWGFDGGDAWSTALAATWEKGQSWPTIAIGNYIDRTEESFPWGTCTDNWLHRPAATADRFAPPVPLVPSFCALSMLFTDWNRSGTPSLRISNDREYYKGGTEQLWRVDPGQPPAPYTAKDGWKPLKIWGMGIAASDINGDGYPDYFLTSMADSKLQTLADGAAKPNFKDVAFALGAIAQRPYTGGDTRPSTGWHAQFEDVNNDGLADLFVAKGNVSEMPDFAARDPNNLLLQSEDGTFEEAGDRAGVASMQVARGAALADFNRDGLVDLVVVNRNSPAEIWRNTSADAGHWIGIDLRQPGTNTDAIGSWIEVRTGTRTSRREITVGGGHAGGVLGMYVFGLGGDSAAEMRVIWPEGKASDWVTLAADAYYRVTPDAPPAAIAP